MDMTAKKMLQGTILPSKDIDCNFPYYNELLVTDAMRVFAKYHVELALKAANATAAMVLNDGEVRYSHTTRGDRTFTVNKEEIFKSYPLSNIK